MHGYIFMALTLDVANDFRCPHDEFSAQLLNSYFATSGATAHPPEDLLALLSIPCFIQMVDLTPWGVGVPTQDSPRDSREAI